MIGYISVTKVCEFTGMTRPTITRYCKQGNFFEHTIQNGACSNWYVKAEVDESGNVNGIYLKDHGLLQAKLVK